MKLQISIIVVTIVIDTATGMATVMATGVRAMSPESETILLKEM